MRDYEELIPEAQAERDQFDAEYASRGCDCFTGCAPCCFCTHPGNPMNQEEDDTAWVKEPAVPTPAPRPVKARDMWKLLDG